MKQVAVISQQVSVIVLGGLFCLCGCDSFRFAATGAPENAWLHERVCATAADAARDEAASEALCGLTALAHRQSEAFVVDYGLPESLGHGQAEAQPGTQNHGQAELDHATLENCQAVAANAKADAAKRPDVWAVADGVLELGLALAGLVGGVYGVRAAGYLKTAREKSRAMKEIIAGNELFKQLYPEQAQRFKEAQQKQSPATKQLVTAEKTG